METEAQRLYVEMLGEVNFESYAEVAKKSNIPGSYLWISQVLRVDFCAEKDFQGAAFLLLGQAFETPDEAEIALNYAEAIAALNSHEDTLVRAERIVGLSVLSEEGKSVNAGAVKSKVEDYFAGPMTRVRLKHLEALMDAEITH